MKRRHVLIVVLVVALAGCASAPIRMTTQQSPQAGSCGVIVVSSTQVVDALGKAEVAFVAREAFNYLMSVLPEGGSLAVDLNDTPLAAEIFRKHFGSFEIDEKKAAHAAHERNCATALIVYFAFTGGSVQVVDDLKLYDSCSIYAWLIDAETGEVLRAAHAPLLSYDRKIHDPKGSPGDLTHDYVQYLKSLISRVVTASDTER